MVERYVITKPSNGGKECPHLNETHECNTQPCPIDCIVGDYRKTGECSVTCGNGTQIYVRDVVQKPGHNGKECPELNKAEVCIEVPCPKDCVVSDFEPAGPCNATCGGGYMLYQRYVEKKPSNGGNCPHLKEYRPCNEEPCPGE